MAQAGSRLRVTDRRKRVNRASETECELRSLDILRRDSVLDCGSPLPLFILPAPNQAQAVNIRLRRRSSGCALRGSFASPPGRKKIAHRFIGGYERGCEGKVPPGTKELCHP